MNKEKVVIAGCGGHAKIVLDILEDMQSYDIVGFTDKEAGKKKSFMGYPILGTDEFLPDLYKKGIINLAIGVGGYKNNKLRKHVYQKYKNMGFNFVSAVHPTATLSRKIELGEAITIFPGALINTDVRIGNNVIIATGSSIDHETQIGDHVLISAGVTIGANVNISEMALIALGAKVISGVNIGKNSLIAAGSVVIDDIGSNARVYGIPARPR